jgi:hypothetical protein
VEDEGEEEHEDQGRGFAHCVEGQGYEFERQVREANVERGGDGRGERLLASGCRMEWEMLAMWRCNGMHRCSHVIFPRRIPLRLERIWPYPPDE